MPTQMSRRPRSFVYRRVLKRPLVNRAVLSLLLRVVSRTVSNVERTFHVVVASDTFGVPQRRCLGTRFSSGHTCQLKRLAAFDAVYRLYTFFSFIGLLIPVPRRSPFERSTFFVRSRRSDSS